MARFVALTLIIELDINLPLLMDSIDFLHIVGRVYHQRGLLGDRISKLIVDAVWDEGIQSAGEFLRFLENEQIFFR